MDPDGDSKIQGQRKQIGFIQGYLANASDVLSPLWLRRPIQVIDGNNWFILGCRYRFLFYFRVLLVIVYFLFENPL